MGENLSKASLCNDLCNKQRTQTQTIKIAPTCGGYAVRVPTGYPPLYAALKCVYVELILEICVAISKAKQIFVQKGS
jgi:hypothetical protein